MIIDDDDEMRTLMSQQLGVLYDVAGFPSGESALAFLGKDDEELPQIILLDISMNGMDGYEVVGRLKGNEKYKKIPVVRLRRLGLVI